MLLVRFLELLWAAGGTQGDRAAHFHKIRPESLGWRRLLQTDFTFSKLYFTRQCKFEISIIDMWRF